jgi:hypothetical protein
MNRMLAGLAVVAVTAVVAVSAAYAVGGYYHDGGSTPGAQFTPGNIKTRNASATWLSGWSGYTGVARDGAWVQLDQNSSGSGYVPTYTSVAAACGNSSSVSYHITCYTSNL